MHYLEYWWTNLWHSKLNHLNLRSMQKIVNENTIIGHPNLKIEEENTCGECYIGEQTKMWHKKVQHLTTIRVLELLYMDLMGPIQFEFLWGRIYICVYVDDFSRYTWFEFIRENFYTFTTFQSLCHYLRCEKGEEICKITRICSNHGREF